MEKYYVPFFTALVIAYILTPVAKILAHKFRAIDIPKDNRRVHKKPTPLMGGLAIYFATIISMLIFMPITRTNLLIMLGGTIILIAGIIDDIKSISPKAKLVAQIAAALVLVAGGVKIEFLSNPFSPGEMIYLKTFSIPVTIFWIVGITNTLNLIDGLDGLASGVASIASMSLLFAASINGFMWVMILSAIVAGASLGFLPHNFNPAKIFMGDTGALFLGYMLSVIAIEGVMKSVAAIAIAVPILALGLPIFDTTFAIFRRVINKKPISEADKGHLHHRLLDRGLTQRQTVLILYVISMFLGTLAVLLTEVEPDKGVVILGIVSLFILLGATRMGLFEFTSQSGIDDRKNMNMKG
jgi:UDP-GlcNAc:undecaprenyl-phosphate GlcNAc-1-phosphate transferase